MISIVQYSRNDNHGGQLFERMQLSYYTNIHFLEKHKIESEIILVDYNTQEDKKNLYEILPIKKKYKYVKIRHIIVPPIVHTRYKDHKKLPMNNMVARNIGIRRVKGDFILSTGIDILFSEALIKKFQTLQSDILYRTHRYDIHKSILELKKEHLDILDFCEKNIIDIHFQTNKGYLANSDIPLLHTNNCGDFQLAHRDIWHSLYGYPEIDLIGTHCDTIFSYMCYLAGYKEVVLDEKLYHIDHDSRWLKPIYTHILRNWRLLYKEFGEDVMQFKEKYYALAKEVSQKSNEKTTLEKIDIKVLSNLEFENIVLKMYEMKNYRYNDSNWGLGNMNFKEVIYG